jgi:hypothetical protein
VDVASLRRHKLTTAAGTATLFSLRRQASGGGT